MGGDVKKTFFKRQHVETLIDISTYFFSLIINLSIKL